jgi:hypothetical protein
VIGSGAARRLKRLVGIVEPGRVVCPEPGCANRTPWPHVARTGRCPFGHAQRPVVIRGGRT